MVVKCSVCGVPAAECLEEFVKDDRDGRPLCGFCLDGLRAFGYNAETLIDAVHYLMGGVESK